MSTIKVPRGYWRGCGAGLLAVVLVMLGVAPASAAGLAVDRSVTTHQSAASTSITSPALSTAGPGEVLVAFITSDGPAAGGSQTFSVVTGGGLAWRLRRRANTQAGTAEIWQAAAPAVVTNATVTATRGAGSWAGSITVVAFSGAEQVVDGATASAGASTGAPTVALTTTRAGSWVWGVGNDWDRAAARTVGTGQAKVDEYLAPAGDTLWVQDLATPTPFNATQVTVNDTAPTADRWNLAAIEILPAATAVDTQPPSSPGGLAAGAVTSTQVPLSWSASTDNQGVAGYRVVRDGTQIADVPATTYTDKSAAPSTTYSYTVIAYDAAGNLSGPSSALSVTTPAATDTTPPTVSLTAPVAGANLSGTTTLTAAAADAGGVAGVQFLLDGTPIGAEAMSAPYSLSWDSTSAANGSHTLAARARDSSGNSATSASVTVTVSNGLGGPAQVGQWGSLIPLPAVAIHSALLPSGRILLWQGDFARGGQQYVLDPQTGTVTHVADAAADLFCAGQAVLADGRVLVVGGTATSGGLGVNDITAFNWQGETWSGLAKMQYPRWYATGTTLADGKVLVTSGDNASYSDIVPIPELYSPNTNTWQSLTAASNAMPVYPFIYQLPDGRIAHLGGSEVPTASEVLDLSTNKWTSLDSRVIDGGSIANYAPGRFIKAGSAADDGFSGSSLNTAYTLDMNSAGATWQPTSSMVFPRSFLNLTNLPDGTVLATGGGTDKSGYVDANAVLPAEAWDPSSGKWATYAPMAAPRLYHSVAMLLPDGRVYVGGGGGAGQVTNQLSAQLFSPPYLFKGPRPVITSAPSTVQYGSSAFVGTPDAASITRVSLIRTGSVTHAFDQNARATKLSFTQAAGGLNVTLPANRNDVPPGHYMLFIVNGSGVPSVAPLVRFPAPYEDTQPPSSPGGLAAGAVTSTQVPLSWSASTDNQGVAGYRVVRDGTQIADVPGTTYTDKSAAPSTTYSYTVIAYDAAGNVSGPSSALSVTTPAATDTTPPTVSLTAPVAGANLSGTTTLTAAAADAGGVAGVQFLLDGTPIGAEAMSAPYSLSWDSTSAANGSHTLAARARDSSGNSATSASVTVTVSNQAAGTITPDSTVTVHQSTAAPALVSPGLTTASANEVILAFIAADGPSGSTSSSFASVSGGGLAWRLRQRTNTQAGTAEIWQAVAATPVSKMVVTAQRSSGSFTGSMTVTSFKNVSTSIDGAVTSANASSGAPKATLTTTHPGSWVWAVGNDYDRAASRTVGASQTKVDEYLSPSGDTYWAQRQNSVTPTAGTAVTIDDTAPTNDRWNLSVIELVAAGGPADTTPPNAQMTAPADGATVSGSVNVSAAASDSSGIAGVQFLLDGKPLGNEVTAAPYTLSWNTRAAVNGSHVLSASARDPAGNSATSSAVGVTVSNAASAAAPSLDAATPAASPVLNNVTATTSPSFSPPAKSVIYAVFSMDSPASSTITTVSSVTNSGTPLTWHLLGRENHNDGSSVGGFVEVWWAYSASSQSAITATATFSSPTKNVPAPVGDFQVLVMDNAAADQSAAAWTPNWLITGSNNAASATVTTTAPNSRVFGVFDNWDNSNTPVPGADQSIISIVLNSVDRDGYWVQSKDTPVTTPGPVQMDATIVGNANPWHAIAWEVLAAP